MPGKLKLLAVLGLLFVNCSLILFSQDVKESKMKTCIVYYSFTGNTEAAAKTIAQELNADLVKLEDVKKPSTLKAYVSGSFAALKEKSWPISSIKDISDCQRIFIGAPVWAGKAAPEMNTFISQTDFSGKDVVIFVTMASSDPKEAINSMSTKVTAKGGKVVSSFSIKTAGLNKDAVAAKAREIAKQY